MDGAQRLAWLEDYAGAQARHAETGSHGELMARGGRYAQLYQIQARAYQ
jgi:hypothetical protein